MASNVFSHSAEQKSDHLPAIWDYLRIHLSAASCVNLASCINESRTRRFSRRFDAYRSTGRPNFSLF